MLAATPSSPRGVNLHGHWGRRLGLFLDCGFVLGGPFGTDPCARKPGRLLRSEGSPACRRSGETCHRAGPRPSLVLTGSPAPGRATAGRRDHPRPTGSWALGTSCLPSPCASRFNAAPASLHPIRASSFPAVFCRRLPRLILTSHLIPRRRPQGRKPRPCESPGGSHLGIVHLAGKRNKNTFFGQKEFKISRQVER